MGDKKKRLIQPTLFGSVAVGSGYKSSKTKDRSDYHGTGEYHHQKNSFAPLIL